MSATNNTITPADVSRAQQRLTEVVTKPPILKNTLLDKKFNCELFIQCENQQKTGAFKYRGASNAILGLLESGVLNQHSQGVCTHSSGNHGKALARAGRLHHIPVEVISPANALATKIAAMQTEGARVHLCETTQSARESGLADLVAKGLLPVPPYDHPLVIAGQGTWVLDLVEQVPDLDILLTPVGGGGLLAGTLLARDLLLQQGRGNIKVFGAEPKQADDCYQSLKQGRRLEQYTPDTVADGLRALIGKLTFPIIQAGVEAVLPISETEILSAQKLVKDTLGQIIEPSSATVFAAIIRYPDIFSGKRVGLIITGGNLDAS